MKQFLLRLWKDEAGGAVGRLALGVGGAAIGFAIGGPFGAAAFGAQLGFLGGTIAGNILFPQELPDIEGQRLDPNQMMTSAYGNPIPIGFGRFIVGGTVVYYPGFKETVIEEEVGGKGGPTQTARSYTYTGSFRVNLCEGPVDSILKVWANRILIYDKTSTGNPIINWQKLQEAPGVNAIRFYTGEETQMPDPTEQADKGVGATPAYRGIAGIFFQNYPLDDSGGVPPQITALVSTSGTEVLSTDTMSNPGGFDNSAYWEWQPGLNSWLMMSMTRVDNTTQTMIANNSGINGDQLFPCVDSKGDFWSISRSRSFRKYDGITLQQIGSTVTWKNPFDGSSVGNDSLHWEDGRVFGGYRTLDGTLIGERLFFAEAKFFSADQPCVVVDLDNHADSLFGGVINTWEQVGDTEIRQSLIVDNERFLWFMSTDSGISTLERVSPGTGSVIEQYDLDQSYSNITFDRATNSIIVLANSTHIIRWGIDSHAEDARLVLDGVTLQDDKNLTTLRAGTTSDGRIYLQTGAALGSFTEFSVYGSMSQGRTYSPGTDFGLPSSTTHRGFFDETRNAVIKRHDTTGDNFYLYLDRRDGDLIQVKDIVEPVSERVGVDLSDIVTSNLTQQLHGYLIGQRVQAKSALMPLSQMFFFSPVSEDFVIKFPILGGASVATILEDDLAADAGNIRVEKDKLSEQYLQEIELPELMELGYNNEQAEYQVQYQRAKRPRSTTNTKRKKRLSFPGTFISNSDAAQRLETILYNIWTKRRPVEFSTSQKWLRLSPADVVTVTHEGATQDTAIGSVNLGVNNVIEFMGSAEDPTIQTSLATGAEGALPDQTIPVTLPSEYFVMDIPLLRDQDDGFGVYIAMGPFGNGTFPGGEIFRGLDGTVYAPFHYISASRAMDHGFVVGTLADTVERDVWDRDNSLTITMSRGTLASSTEDLVLNGEANALLIGNEIVMFVTSVDNGDGTFTISQLLRGRRGTEGEIGSHVAGEKCVVLASTSLYRKGLDSSEQGVSFFYKGVTRGGSLANGFKKTIAVDGKSQWVWGPAHVAGSISANDWTVNWVPRIRINNSWKNLFGVPGPNDPFNYEVDILSGPGGTVLNTYSTTTSANGSVVTAASHQFFYDDADQTIDFGSTQTTITFKIYPVSPVVGRGFPTEVTLVGG